MFGHATVGPYQKYGCGVVYLDWADVHPVLQALSSSCDHPAERVVWKLQTSEYVCRSCETVFPYAKVRAFLEDRIKEVDYG